MITAEALGEIMTAHAPLAPRTSFGIGGTARQFVEPRSLEELCAVIGYFRETGTAYRILGGGTNILVKSREIAEPVLHLGKMRSMLLNGATLRAEAGVPLGRLVTQCGEAGLAGPEALAGVPGTVGGAAVMNAGGKNGYIGGMVKEVVILDDAGLKTLRANEITFAYRTSSLRGKTVASVTLALKKDDRGEIARRRRGILAEKKLSQPLKARSAGCIFRNPPGGQAGRLIDEAGFKGARAGGAFVSPVHANFIVNAGGATAADVLSLIDRIRKKISQIHNLALELEIELW
jgi:UDP-N-acetylmuramate dehydrogenase